MKLKFLPLLLALLLLTGCASLLDRSDVSATAHVDYSVTEDASILRAESYPELVSAILYFINERAEEGTVRLYNYTGNVSRDLDDAVLEITTRDPLSVYSVKDITYRSTRILSYYEVDLSFAYSRTREEVASIREIVGISELRDQLDAMVDSQATALTLMVSYFSGSEDLVWQLLTLSRTARPELYVDPGGSFDYRISIYPETGTRRIVEIRVDNWGAGRHAGRAALQGYASRLETASAGLLAQTPPAGTAYTVPELVAILRTAAGGYDYHGSQLAMAPLTGSPASEQGYLLAMCHLCQQAGVEVIPVFSPPHQWLIVATEEGYRHLLPADIFTLPEPPAGETPEEQPEPPAEGEVPPEPPLPTPEELRQIPLYTDRELAELGYTWARSLYPLCEGAEPEVNPEPEVSPGPEVSPAPESSADPQEET